MKVALRDSSDAPYQFNDINQLILFWPAWLSLEGYTNNRGKAKLGIKPKARNVSCQLVFTFPFDSISTTIIVFPARSSLGKHVNRHWQNYTIAFHGTKQIERIDDKLLLVAFVHLRISSKKRNKRNTKRMTEGN